MSPREYLDAPGWFIDRLAKKLEKDIESAGESSHKRPIHYIELHILRALRLAGI